MVCFCATTAQFTIHAVLACSIVRFLTGPLLGLRESTRPNPICTLADSLKPFLQNAGLFRFSCLLRQTVSARRSCTCVPAWIGHKLCCILVVLCRLLVCFLHHAFSTASSGRSLPALEGAAQAPIGPKALSDVPAVHAYGRVRSQATSKLLPSPRAYMGQMQSIYFRTCHTGKTHVFRSLMTVRISVCIVDLTNKVPPLFAHRDQR